MPNRVLREGILSSEAVNLLSEEGEIFYRRLMSVVDDYGRFELNLELLRARCFPLQLDRWPVPRVKRALDDCSRLDNCQANDGHPLVTVYEGPEGKRKYLQINNFQQRTRSESRCPAPSARSCVDELRSHDGHPRASRARTSSSTSTSSYTSPSAEIPAADESPAPPPSLVPAPEWRGDQAFSAFADLYRSTGAPVIDEDFTNAWMFVWKRLDWEQKAQRQKALDLRIAEGAWDDPRYIPRPEKFLTTEWKRPLPPKGKSKAQKNSEGWDNVP